MFLYIYIYSLYLGRETFQGHCIFLKMYISLSLSVNFNFSREQRRSQQNHFLQSHFLHRTEEMPAMSMIEVPGENYRPSEETGRA